MVVPQRSQARSIRSLRRQTSVWAAFAAYLSLIALHGPSISQADAIYVGNRPLLRAYRLTRLRAQQEWTYSPEVLCNSARVYGRMSKKATREDMPWRLWSMAQQHTLDPNIPIYAGVSIYISRKYRVLYVRQQKSSSSSIIQALERLFCRNPAACTEDEFQHNMHPLTQRVWKEYLVFTWVRNPWMRMMSTYSMICGGVRDDVLLRSKGPGDAPGDRCYVPFSDFSRDPYTMVRACPEHSCCLWHYGHWEPEFIPGHLNDQSHTIFAQDGRSMVDFIGRTEHINEDWAEFLLLLNKHAGTDFRASSVPMENPNPATKQQDGEGVYASCLGRRYQLFNETTMRDIALQFAMDLYMLGYDDPRGGHGAVQNV